MWISDPKVFYNLILGYSTIALMVLLVGYVGVTNSSLFNAPSTSYKIGAIAGVEITAVRDWQRQGGIHGNLAYGDVGNEVKLVQQLLVTKYPSFGSDSITGYFGSLTVEHIKTFQRDNGLEETGVVDKATREALNGVYLSELCPTPDSYYPDMTQSVVNKQNSLPLDYSPNQLINLVGLVATDGIVCASSHIVDDLIRLYNDAKEDGIILAITSGYRHPQVQQLIFDYWHGQDGEETLDEVALPGRSEHQLGTAIDFTGQESGFQPVPDGFENTREGKWLARNAHKYGFVLSYPRGSEAITGYHFEPWHYRHVGVEKAEKIHKSGQSLNEYLANNPIFPRFDRTKEQLKMHSRVHYSIYKDDFQERVLTSNNSDLQTPIASITKLMTAAVALDSYNASTIFEVSTKTQSHPSLRHSIRAGQKFTLDQVLHMILIESNNAAAEMLAEKMGREKFIAKMNETARILGMNNTYYGNPTGLDDDNETKMNFSSAEDLAKLAIYIYEKHREILEISRKDNYQIKSIGLNRDDNHHTALATNKLLGGNVGLKILGGKTGDTDLAKKNLLIFTESPTRGGFILNIVLGSDDHFRDMGNLVAWTKNSFKWFNQISSL